MADLGQPASYLVLGKGAPVYSCDEHEVGKVREVRADEAEDIFDGLMLDTSLLPGGERYVPAEHVEEIFEKGVLLKLDRAAVESLPQG